MLDKVKSKLRPLLLGTGVVVSIPVVFLVLFAGFLASTEVICKYELATYPENKVAGEIISLQRQLMNGTNFDLIYTEIKKGSCSNSCEFTCFTNHRDYYVYGSQLETKDLSRELKSRLIVNGWEYENNDPAVHDFYYKEVNNRLYKIRLDIFDKERFRVYNDSAKNKLETGGYLSSYSIDLIHEGENIAHGNK